MKNLFPIFIFFLVIFLSGCTTSQKINKLDASTGRVNLVCIVEHKAVRETALEVIQEGLTSHGVKYRVIPGSYEIKNKLWTPTFQDDQATGCDAMLFYVANWHWDIAMYMNFASIWMTTPDRRKQLGFASYDARASLNKFISARTKLLELTDGLFDQYKNPALPKQVSVPDTPAPTPTTTAANTTSPSLAPAITTAPTIAKTNNAAASSSSTSQKLRELQDLKKDGLITEEDYQLKKKQLLEKF